MRAKNKISIGLLKKKKLYYFYEFYPHFECKKQNINLAFTLIKNLSQFVMAKAQWGVEDTALYENISFLSRPYGPCLLADTYH